MKVLTVTNEQPFYGGAEIVTDKLSHYLSEHGIEEFIVAPKIAPELRKSLSATTAQIFETGSDGDLLSKWNRCREKAMELSKSADVINVTNFPASLVTPWVPLPAVWMCHEPPEVFKAKNENAMKQLLRQATLFMNRQVAHRRIDVSIVADMYNLGRYVRLYGMNRHGHTPLVIRYGVDYEFWSAPTQAAIDESYRIIQVGTVTKLKNQEATIKAFIAIKDRIPEATLDIVGWDNLEPEYTNHLKDLIMDARIESRVKWWGGQSQKGVRTFYASSHLLVHPCGRQGGALTPFEAICAGVPVIVSPEAGVASDIFEHYLGKVATDKELPEAIMDAYRRRADHLKMVADAAAWLKTNRTWDNFCSQYVEAMNQAIKEYVTK